MQAHRPLRDALARDHMHIFLFTDGSRLLCSHDDVGVVWQDEDMIRIHLADGLYEVFRRRFIVWSAS